MTVVPSATTRLCARPRSQPGHITPDYRNPNCRAQANARSRTSLVWTTNVIACHPSTIQRPAFRRPGFLDWDMRLLGEFRIGDQMRVDFSIEGFNLTRASNKQFNGDGESPFGSPQAAVNPKTGLAFSGSTALVPTSSPGTDYFGGARQAQFGVRFVFKGRD